MKLKVKYDAGASIRQLAEESGRSYGAINRLLNEAGASLRGRGGARNRLSRAADRPPTRRSSPRRVPNSEREALAARLKADHEATHCTVGDLAQKHGLTYHLVATLLHEAGAQVPQDPRA
jgi:transposase